MGLNVLNLGKCEYQKALEIQYKLLEKRQKDEIEDTLILVEHPPVITLGRHAILSNISVSEEYLKNIGIQVHQIERGGDVTYHGDGQIVGYPIVKLRAKGIGIKNFVDGIEETFIELLEENCNIVSGRHPEHTGVWVENNKIAAIGLAVKRGVTIHGFAFNVNTNLDHFKYIVPCGILDKGVTSIEKLIGRTVDFEYVNNLVQKHFCKVFNYTTSRQLELKDID